jgi:hypothetical protein
MPAKANAFEAPQRVREAKQLLMLSRPPRFQSPEASIASHVVSGTGLASLFSMQSVYS